MKGDFALAKFLTHIISLCLCKHPQEHEQCIRIHCQDHSIHWKKRALETVSDSASTGVVSTRQGKCSKVSESKFKGPERKENIGCWGHSGRSRLITAESKRELTRGSSQVKAIQLSHDHQKVCLSYVILQSSLYPLFCNHGGHMSRCWPKKEPGFESVSWNPAAQIPNLLPDLSEEQEINLHYIKGARFEDGLSQQLALFTLVNAPGLGKRSLSPISITHLTSGLELYHLHAKTLEERLHHGVSHLIWLYSLSF